MEDSPVLSSRPTAASLRAEESTRLQDLTFTLRLAPFSTSAVSASQPAVVYLGSESGYVWKTLDGGRSWQESILITERRPFFGDAGELLFFGSHRSDGAPDPFRSRGSSSDNSEFGLAARTACLA